MLLASSPPPMFFRFTDKRRTLDRPVARQRFTSRRRDAFVFAARESWLLFSSAVCYEPCRVASEELRQDKLTGSAVPAYANRHSLCISSSISGDSEPGVASICSTADCSSAIC
jgi:hypothetical protein